MSYLTKNYATPDKLTIGGEIALVGDGKITKDGQPLDIGGGAELADGSVTTVKLANKAVTSAKIADATITAAQLANTTVTLAKLAADVTTALNGKLTATKAAAVPDTAPTDVDGVAKELHDLKASLRAAGILS